MKTDVRPLFVVLKALCLFVLINILFAVVNPRIADFSTYNKFFPGLARMPFGDSSDSLTVTVDDVRAMFAAHAISSEKQPDELRVVLIGDSSIWGDGLSVHDTLSEQLNRLGSQCNGKTIKVYNLGYPHPSILKDLVFIDEVKKRQPDLIIWFMTLNTLMNQSRLNPFITENREHILKLLDAYDISFAPRKTLSEQQESFYQKTVIGKRSFLARWIKLQALGITWSATNEDLRVVPIHAEAISLDVKKDPRYRNIPPGTDLRTSLLLDVLDAGFDIAGETPVILVNEPIFIATGVHSEIRYNDLYPRWAYDQYRAVIATETQTSSWRYLDLWDAIPPKYFTDASFHLSAEGERLLADRVKPTLGSEVCQ